MKSVLIMGLLLMTIYIYIYAGVVPIKMSAEKHEYVLAPSTTGTKYVKEKITINDYYPEGTDGTRKFFVAAYIQQTYKNEPTIIEIPDAIQNNLTWALYDKVLHETNNKWQWDSYVQSYGENANIDTLKNFFKTVDERTDGNDRIILILVGHGTVNESNGEYLFELGDGELVPADTLIKLMKTLGPALDFVWFLSCYSDTILNNINPLDKPIPDLDGAAYEYIMLGCDGELYYSVGADAVNTITSMILHGVTIVGPVDSYNDNESICSALRDYGWVEYDSVLLRWENINMFLYTPFPSEPPEDYSAGSSTGAVYIPIHSIFPY